MKNKKSILTVISLIGLFSAGYANAQAWGVGNLSGYGLPGGSISNIIETLLMWLLGIFGFIGIIGFIVAGIYYLTAAGDENQISRAKNAMLYSIIGVIIGISGYVIIQAIDWALTGTITNY